MSPLTRALVAAALTLPLVAFVVGALAAPDEPTEDRSRPVIIEPAGDGAQDQDGKKRDQGRKDRDRPPRDPAGQGGEPGRGEEDGPDDGPDDIPDDDPDDDDGDGADTFTVITPAPRDLDDDDDGGDDDDRDEDAGDDSDED